MPRTREETEAIAYEAATTWMVFKNMVEEGYHSEEDDEWHEYPPEAKAIWGLLVNPANPHDVITLTTHEDGYVCLDGHRFELDTYVWALSDICKEQQ
jgi:hypothetical protein